MSSPAARGSEPVPGWWTCQPRHRICRPYTPTPPVQRWYRERDHAGLLSCRPSTSPSAHGKSPLGSRERPRAISSRHPRVGYAPPGRTRPAEGEPRRRCARAAPAIRAIARSTRCSPCTRRRSSRAAVAPLAEEEGRAAGAARAEEIDGSRESERERRESARARSPRAARPTRARTIASLSHRAWMWRGSGRSAASIIRSRQVGPSASAPQTAGPRIPAFRGRQVPPACCATRWPSALPDSA